MSKPELRPSGKWRVRWTDENGKRRCATFNTQAAARAGLRRNEVAVDNVRSGKARPKSQLTLRDAAKEWLEARPPKRAHYNKIHLDLHIEPYMGDTPLARITPDLVQRFIRHLEQKKTQRRGAKNLNGRTLSRATVNNVLITLRKILNDTGFPMRIRYKVPMGEHQWIRTKADVGAFVDACKHHGSWFQVAAALAVYSGLRKGEVAGLRIDALDFERSIIRVDRSYDGPTKSKHMRHVPMPTELADILRLWLWHDGKVGGILRRGPLVVESPVGPITLKTDLAQKARRACKRAGIDDSVNFHGLRHTNASHLSEGNSLAIVGALLGHVDPKTTARYSHLSTEHVAQRVTAHLAFGAGAPEAKVVPLRSVSASGPDMVLTKTEKR